MKHNSTAKELKHAKSKMKEAIVAKENSDRILKINDSEKREISKSR